MSIVMLRSAALFFSIAALAAAAPASNGSSTVHQLDTICIPGLITQTKSCLDAYFRGYGLNPDKLPPFTDYVKNIIDICTLYGPTVVDIFCSYEQTIENCLGPLFNSPCMTAGAFQEMYGMSVPESYEYATDFPMRAYMCDNKQFMKDNQACFDDVVTTHIDERRACTTAVEKAIGNVADGDYCKPWGPFVTCNDDVYVKYCGQKVKGYICNVLEVGINFDSKNACTSSLPKC